MGFMDVPYDYNYYKLLQMRHATTTARQTVIHQTSTKNFDTIIMETFVSMGFLPFSKYLLVLNIVSLCALKVVQSILILWIRKPRFPKEKTVHIWRPYPCKAIYLLSKCLNT